MTPSTVRMRIHRQRLQRGLKCVTIELRSSEIKELIRRGYATEATATSTEAIRKALYAFLDCNLSASV
jgi:hypothetical protein